MSSMPEDLLARITRLERQNRRQRGFLLGLAGAGAAVLALLPLAAGSQNRRLATLEDNGLVLHNTAGQRVGWFGVDERGIVKLAMRDGQDRERVTVGVDQQGGSILSFWDTAGKQRVSLGYTDRGAAILLFGQDQKIRFAAVTTADGTPLIETYDANGKLTWKPQPGGR